MLHIVLFQPEIPPNTGNIMRLCANTGNQLHLIRPLGFALEDKHLRRAGLDYREWADVSVYEDLAGFCAHHQNARLLAFSTKGNVRLDQMQYQAGDALLFGPETRGLPAELLNGLPAGQCIRIPMLPNNRSLNLANAVAIACYEAWRQLGFCGAK